MPICVTQDDATIPHVGLMLIRMGRSGTESVAIGKERGVRSSSPSTMVIGIPMSPKMLDIGLIPMMLSCFRN